jgi:CheY-like chemotaxis protein
MTNFNQATDANHLLDEHRRMTNGLASILIVDDNDDLRRTLRNLFADRGYRVRTAADGFLALAEMRSELPDVLISDLDMPRMSGFELLIVVRERFPEVGVIAMSGAYSGNGVPRGLAANAFYPKDGTSHSRLPELVDAIIGRDRSHARRRIA